MNEYHHSSHRVYDLKAHIVLVTKYRYNIIRNDFESWLISCMKAIAAQKDCHIKEIKADQNHIHILIDYSLFISGEQLIRVLKGKSTIEAYKAWRDYLNEQYKGERLLWSGGGFMCSTGAGNETIVTEYIRNQGLK